MGITSCHAYKIKDSRGEGTLEVEIFAGELSAKASVPSGKSTGSREAVVLSVDKAIKNVNGVISQELIRRKVKIKEIDNFLLKLDGSTNKSKLGSNAILAVSVAGLRLSAKIANQPLWRYIQLLGGWTSKDFVDDLGRFPRLFANVLNGGVHADSRSVETNFHLTGVRLPFQEYMFVLGNGLNVAGPINQLRVLSEQLRVKLEETQKDIKIGDEGGFSFRSDNLEEPFEILSGLHDKLAIDVAAGEFYKKGKYNILDKDYSSEELLNVYNSLVDKFPLVSIEDPFSENDFDGFKKIMENVGKETLIVGDDLTTTNPREVANAIAGKMINAVIIKPNQIGTVLETLKAVKISQENNLKVIVSHRSGETMDSFIADLAVGVGAYGIKAGALSQSERAVKYERLIEIEKEVEKC